MPISINGTGTITGISAGGLPDGSIVADDLASGAVTTAKVNDAAITFAKLSTSATESDNVESRVAKAWVYFNGQGAVSIQSDFNVSSITDNGTGDYTINFSASFSDAKYSIVASAAPNYGTATTIACVNTRASGTIESAPTSSAARISTLTPSPYDSEYIYASIFR